MLNAYAELVEAYINELFEKELVNRGSVSA